MKALMKSLITIAAVASILLLAQPMASAKKSSDWVPPGQAKKAAAQSQSEKHHGKSHSEDTATSTPPGWSKGKKTGWHGSPYPPGWSKWDDKKRRQWTGDRDEAVRDIHGLTTQYRIPTAKADEITQAFNQAIAGGLIVNDAKNKLVSALKDENTRKGLMINTSQSVLELLK